MKLPKSINPCPIVEAVIEIRFDTIVPQNAVFGIIYNGLKSLLEVEPTNLPILQIPENIRLNDSSFKFKPHYEFKKGDDVIQVGPDVLLYSIGHNYRGWDESSNDIYRLLEEVFNLKFIKNINRLGLRYINFFEEEIYDSINIDINLNGEPINYNKTILNTSFNHGTFSSTLRISNISKVNNKDGSIIDIDTYCDLELPVEDDINEKVVKLIEEGHLEEKKLFYSLLKKEYTDKIEVKY